MGRAATPLAAAALDGSCFVAKEASLLCEAATQGEEESLTSQSSTRAPYLDHVKTIMRQLITFLK